MFIGSFLKKCALVVVGLCLSANVLWATDADAQKAKAQVAVPHISQLVKKNEAGHWSGPLIDVLHQVEKNADIKFDLRIVPFKRAVMMTSEGDADFGVFMQSPKRNEMAMPVIKLGDAMYVLVTLKERPISSLADLEGKTVARVRGGTDIKSLSAIKNITYHLYNTQDDGIRLLKGKRVDALLTADFRILEAVERLDLSLDEIAPPIAVEARELWLFWSWKSHLDFNLVRKIKNGPPVSLDILDPASLFESYKRN